VNKSTAILTTETLPAWAVPAMLDKVAKANRKAARAGIDGFYTAETTLYTEVVSYWDHAKGQRAVRHDRMGRVDVYGQTLSVDGWTFAATVDWSLGEAIVRTVPGMEVAIPTTRGCEHCGSERHRKDTFIVIAEDGTQRQVGRNCLTAYTGIPVGWVSLWEPKGMTVEVGFGMSGDKSRYTRDALALCAAIVRLHGYTSRKAVMEAGEHSKLTATSSRVMTYLYPDAKFRTEADAWIQANVTEADYATADSVLAWGAQGVDGNYGHDLRVILGSESITHRHVGLLASAITGQQRQAEGEAKWAAKRAEWAAEKAEREAAEVHAPAPEGATTVVGTIVSTREQDGFAYGSVEYKMLVKADAGYKVWATIPAAIMDRVGSDDDGWGGTVKGIGDLVGKRIEFTATLCPKSDDPEFAIGKRARKATLAA
jgi:hypothetical protein